MRILARKNVCTGPCTTLYDIDIPVLKSIYGLQAHT